MTSLGAIAFHGVSTDEVNEFASTVKGIFQRRIDRAIKRQRDAERKRRARAVAKAAKLHAFERGCTPSLTLGDGRVVRPIR